MQQKTPLSLVTLIWGKCKETWAYPLPRNPVNDQCPTWQENCENFQFSLIIPDVTISLEDFQIMQ